VLCISVCYLLYTPVYPTFKTTTSFVAFSFARAHCCTYFCSLLRKSYSRQNTIFISSFLLSHTSYLRVSYIYYYYYYYWLLFILIIIYTDYFPFAHNNKTFGFVTEIVAVYCKLETDFLNENNVKLVLQWVKFHSIVILFLIHSEAVCYPFSSLLSLTNCVGAISYLWRVGSWIYDI
jgi:hypothetical protein